MGVLHAYLVRTPGFQRNLRQRPSAAAGQRARYQQRALCAGRIRGNDAHHAVRILSQPVLQAPLRLQTPLKHRQIAAILRVARKSLRKPRGRLRGARENHHAAHWAVETMHKAQVNVAGLGIFLPDIVLENA